MVTPNRKTVNERIGAGLALRIKPLPGHCFAIPTPESEGKIKGIYIPDSALSRNAPGFVAEVIMEHAILSPRNQMTIRGLAGRMCAFARWAGQRFVYDGMDLIRYKLTVEEILAVYFEGDWIPLQSEGHEMHVTTTGDSVPRCRYCKSAGQGNIMLDGSGKCPTCGRNARGRIPERYKYTAPNGQTIDMDEPLRMTEDEREVYGGTGAPQKATGKIMSFGR